VDLYKWMISCRDLIHSHVARHANALLGLTALAAPRRAGCDRTGRTVLAFGSVRCRLTTEVVPLHDARISLALAGTNDVDVLHVGEDFDIDRVAGLFVCWIFQTNFAEVPAGGSAGLGTVADQRESAESRLDLAESELNGVVSFRFN